MKGNFISRWIALIILLSIIGFNAPVIAQTKTTGSNIQTNQPAKPTLAYKIIESGNHTFGYDIFANGKLKIHQPTKPSTPGKNGFATKEDAGKAAELVISKMKNGEALPTLTTADLTRLQLQKMEPQSK